MTTQELIDNLKLMLNMEDEDLEILRKGLISEKEALEDTIKKMQERIYYLVEKIGIIECMIITNDSE